ncbi:Vtc4p [Sugiyamaella lignohabitans]|uniref:Vacuolar transporter chaperone complex subunit 4 n=1 Tax=Sugiyamaella lignohabitans TaxID=796027 RepID=A0A167DVW8_9ASCO|nr:Vtc4p [Sugiyamaella lignohabitans]ANB13353.1 Vtc4p [Sugiyamaella lignohabitans]
MKFGEQLKTSLIKDYYYYYISYDDLKHELKKGSSGNWSETEEEHFVGLLETELDKVFVFQKVKATEINRRIKDAEKQVQEVVRVSESDVNAVDEQQFEDLEEELSDIIADVHDLAKFTRLNYTGFQKIIKKHDKVTGWTLKPIFSVRLNAKPFFKDNYDQLVVKLSKLYDLVRTRGQPVRGDSAAGGAQQNFVRQTTKYWVHPDNITELKLIILKHLPVLVFNANKEFEKEDAAITSIYYDNTQLDLYKGRLEKTEGAEAIRLRWYGGMSSDQIFVERKTHREDWTGEKSVKARFALKEKNVNDFMKGKFTVDQAFEKARREGKKSIKEIESLESLAREVQYAVIKKKLRPVVRSFYNRTAFQLPGDARVRISLDTELTMVREDNFDGLDRAHKNWRRMDIGVDWPFSQLPEKDVERFPYAVLEVKLQTQLGQEPPQWVRELVSSHLVEAVPKFSKFIHGVATLVPEKTKLIPFWLPQMGVDIRKPVNQFYGIERPIHGDSSVSDIDYTGGYADEENGIGGENGVARPAAIRFDNDATERNREAADNETTPLLARDSTTSNGSVSAGNRNSRVRAITYNFPFLAPVVNAWSNAYEWFNGAFIENNYITGLPAGTVFITDLKVPEGKTICMPVRIEPKVYFATERTFLAWLEIGILLGAIAGGLLNYGNALAVEAAVGFFVVAIGTILYAIVLYLWRVKQVRNKTAARYDDRVGPTIICVALAAATGINFYLQATR